MFEVNEQVIVAVFGLTMGTQIFLTRQIVLNEKTGKKGKMKKTLFTEITRSLYSFNVCINVSKSKVLTFSRIT